MKNPSFTLVLATVVACGEGMPNDGGSVAGRPASLRDSLRDLGIDPDSDEPRVGPGGTELEPDDAPLAARSTLDRVDELVVLGLQVPSGESESSDFAVLEVDPEGGATSLLSADEEVAPWGQRELRATGGVDLDGDGKEEIVVAYVDDGAVWVDIFDDAEAGFGKRSERVVQVDGEVLTLSLTGGDFDGDGVDELMIAHTTPGLATLSRATGMSATLTSQLELSGATSESFMRLEMEAARLDVDNPDELAIVINQSDAVASWVALDDARVGFIELGSGGVEARDTSGRAESAAVAGLGVGDFDDDGLDEIGLGGVIEIRPNCDPFEMMVVAIDDAVSRLRVQAQLRESRRYRPCSGVSPWRMENVFVDAVDIDGDGVEELHVNDAVYDDLRSGEWIETWTVDPNAFYPLGDTHGGRLARDETAVAAGDFDADGMAEIAVYNRKSGIDIRSVLFYGLMGPDGVNGFGLKETVPVGSESAPDLVAVNVDSDSTTISYEEGSYEFVFTEPVIIAVLASPPCDASSSQAERGGCQTSFGRTDITGGSEAKQVQTRVSGHVGLEAEGSFFGLFKVAARETISAIRTETRSWERTYRLEETITYTSGHLEDAVVFTTIPYDRYTYTIATHPDPDLVGTRIVVSLPREPITLIADRRYYNAHVVEGAPQIDDAVLTHTIGDVESYPTRQEIASMATRGWLASDVVTVGQGTGSTEVTLTVSEEISRGGTLETGWEVNAEVTGGNVIVGWSAGQSESDSLMVTSGEATTYRGTVPSLDAEGFEDRFYSFGLFTYVKGHRGREFQVLNYWVE